MIAAIRARSRPVWLTTRSRSPARSTTPWPDFRSEFAAPCKEGGGGSGQVRGTPLRSWLESRPWQGARVPGALRASS